MRADRILHLLDLQPHPEGGHYRGRSAILPATRGAAHRGAPIRRRWTQPRPRSASRMSHLQLVAPGCSMYLTPANFDGSWGVAKR
jgi:hypothetical protein